MYVLAKDFFPDNRKLDHKIQRLRQMIQARKDAQEESGDQKHVSIDRKRVPPSYGRDKPISSKNEDGDYQEGDECHSEGDSEFRVKSRKVKLPAKLDEDEIQTPRTKQLLTIINTRDVRQVRLLKGVGVKKAETIIDALCARDTEGEESRMLYNLSQLSRLPGVGARTVDSMRSGLEGGLAVS